MEGVESAPTTPKRREINFVPAPSSNKVEDEKYLVYADWIRSLTLEHQVE